MGLCNIDGFESWEVWEAGEVGVWRIRDLFITWGFPVYTINAPILLEFPIFRSGIYPSLYGPSRVVFRPRYRMRFR